MSMSQPGGPRKPVHLTLGLKGGSRPAPKITLLRKIMDYATLAIVIAIFVFVVKQVDDYLRPDTPAVVPSAAGTGSAPGSTPLAAGPGIIEIPAALILDVNGQTYIGVRGVLEADVWRVDWDEKRAILRAEKYEKSPIVLKAKEKSVKVGESFEPLEFAPIVKNRRLFVPLEWLQKFTDERLSYDKARNKAFFKKLEPEPAPAPATPPTTK